jgi:hypothetical protein
MPRKVKDGAPPGGWEPPGESPIRRPERIAVGSKMVRGKLEWVWKAVTDKMWEEMQAKEAPAPKVRNRRRG